MSTPGLSLDELYARLAKADAAGDTEAAKVFADDIRALESGGGAPEIADFGPGKVKSRVYTTEEARGVPGKTPSFSEALNTPVDMRPGEAEIIPDSPLANKVAYNLFGMAPNFAAGVQRKFAGALRGTRQVLNEYVLNDPAKVAELQREEEAARVRDAPLFKTDAGRYGSYAGTGLSMVMPMGWASKAGQVAKISPMARAALQGGTAAATTGLTTPTVEGESRAPAMWGSGLLGAAGPLAKPGAKLLGGVPLIGPGITRGVDALSEIFSARTANKIREEAGDKIGKITDALQVSPQALATAIRRIDPRLPKDVQQEVRKILHVGTPKPGIRPTGTVPGKTVQLQRKEAGKISRAVAAEVRKGNRVPIEEIRTADAYEQLIGQLDEATAASIKDPKVLKALERAREQYRTGERPMSLQEAVRQGISPALWQTLFAPRPAPPARQRKLKEI